MYGCFPCPELLFAVAVQFLCSLGHTVGRQYLLCERYSWELRKGQCNFAGQIYLTAYKGCGNDRRTWIPLEAQLYQLSLPLTVAKCKVCVKPSDSKASTPTKRALKRKAAEISPSAVAAVKPLSSTETEEPPAKKAALVRRGESVLVKLTLRCNSCRKCGELKCSAGFLSRQSLCAGCWMNGSVCVMLCSPVIPLWPEGLCPLRLHC